MENYRSPNVKIKTRRFEYKLLNAYSFRKKKRQPRMIVQIRYTILYHIPFYVVFFLKKGGSSVDEDSFTYVVGHVLLTSRPTRVDLTCL